MDFELSLKETVEKHQLMAQKSLGQNFLLNENITDKIIRTSLDCQNLPDFSGRYVYEVGPGPGGLTRAVLKQKPQKLTVVEMDARCVQIMTDLQKQTDVPMNIIQGDALQTDFALFDCEPRQVVSNLPYHISVPLLTRWLENLGSFEALTLMFQREVAERIMASIQTKSYGRLSVLAQLTARIDKLMDLNPQCFVPAPKVWSSVLLFRPLSHRPSTPDLKKVSLLTERAFGQRRKMIRQSLKAYPLLEEACQTLHIPLTARAEELTPQQFLDLALILSK